MNYGIHSGMQVEMAAVVAAWEGGNDYMYRIFATSTTQKCDPKKKLKMEKFDKNMWI